MPDIPNQLVFKVIKICSDKKMIRAYTGPIVAMVANQPPFWDWAIMKFPRNTVSQTVSPKCSPRTNMAITIRIFSSFPFPAGRIAGNYVDLVPKSFGEGFPTSRGVCAPRCNRGSSFIPSLIVGMAQTFPSSACSTLIDRAESLVNRHVWLLHSVLLLRSVYYNTTQFVGQYA